MNKVYNHLNKNRNGKEEYANDWPICLEKANLRSSANKVLVDFGRPIGVYVQPGTTTGVMTNFGWVHIGIHVVPTRPF